MKIVTSKINPGIMYGVIITIFLSLGISCANRGKVMHDVPFSSFALTSAPVVKFTPKYNQSPPPQQPVDSTPKRRQISPQDWNKFLAGAYKYNFDNLLAPKFDQLLAAHKLQTQYLIETRRRVDSIVRERNLYRANEYKGKQEALGYQRQAISFQRELITLQKEARIRDGKQILYNTIMAVGALIGVIILLLTYLSLLLRVRAMNKKLDSLIKTMPNV